MKAAPIIRAISDHNATTGEASALIQAILVHTGQHYDAMMSDAFFVDLNLPKPDVFLGVGPGSHAVQTAEIMKRFEEVLLQNHPDIVVVVGDVNSTLACALVTAKASLQPRPFVAHVEAGLRSFDPEMPEERNRVLTDHLSDLLFVTETSGLTNLSNEGIPSNRTFFVGNTMIDSLLAFGAKADKSDVLKRLGLTRTHLEDTNGTQRLAKPYALLTLHRPSNVDQPRAFLEILQGLQELATSHDIIFPAHPRTQKNIQMNRLESYFHRDCYDLAQRNAQPGKIRLTDPKGYLDFVCLMKNASIIITDSGGIQEESTCLGVPCVTVRENTERPVTLTTGTNVLAGVRKEGIRRAIEMQLARKQPNTIPENWDGKAGKRIVEVLRSVERPIQPFEPQPALTFAVHAG